MRIERIQIDITIVDDGFLETITINERREVLEIIPILPVLDEDAVDELMLSWPAGDRLNELLNQKQIEGRAHRPSVEPLKLHNPNTLIKYVRHPDTGKAIGCVVGVQDWDGTTKVGWSQCNPVDKFDKDEAVMRAIDRAFNGSDGKTPSTVKVDNLYIGGPSRVDLFQHEMGVMEQRAKKYFWKPVKEMVASCYECSID